MFIGIFFEINNLLDQLDIIIPSTWQYFSNDNMTTHTDYFDNNGLELSSTLDLCIVFWKETHHSRTVIFLIYLLSVIQCIYLFKSDVYLTSNIYFYSNICCCLSCRINANIELKWDNFMQYGDIRLMYE